MASPGRMLSPLSHLTQSPGPRRDGLLSLVLKKGAPFGQGLGQPGMALCEPSLRLDQNPHVSWDPKILTPPISLPHNLENFRSRRKLGECLFSSILQRKQAQRESHFPKVL